MHVAGGRLGGALHRCLGRRARARQQAPAARACRSMRRSMRRSGRPAAPLPGFPCSALVLEAPQALQRVLRRARASTEQSAISLASCPAGNEWSSLPAGKVGGVGGSRCANVFGTRLPVAAAAARLELVLGGHEVCRPKLVLLHAIKGRSIDTAAAKPAVLRRAGLRPAADRGRRALRTLRWRCRCACRALWV
jgi:hypothetical protein